MIHCYDFLGSSEIVSLLLECGAATDCKNSLGKTAADLAAFTGMFCFYLKICLVIMHFINYQSNLISDIHIIIIYLYDIILSPITVLFITYAKFFKLFRKF